jgi:hypothetical protein
MKEKCVSSSSSAAAAVSNLRENGRLSLLDVNGGSRPIAIRESCIIIRRIANELGVNICQCACSHLIQDTSHRIISAVDTRTFVYITQTAHPSSHVGPYETICYFFSNVLPI